MFKKFFSICIPIYNMCRYLEKCLYSIKKQKFKDYEVIMVDDGSSDNSKDICLNYSRIDSRFKYFHYNNAGVSVARNRLISNSNGKYIIMIDPDDYIDTDALYNIYKKIIEIRDVDLIRFKAIVIDDKPWKNIYRFNYINEIKNPIDGINALKIWSTEEEKKYAVPWLYCIKKELYNNIKFPINRVHEDFAIYPIIISLANKVITLDKICYYYVQHSDSIMHNKNINNELKKLEDWLVNYSNLKKKLSEIFELKKTNEIIKKIIYNDLLKRTISKINSFNQILCKIETV